MSLPQPGAYVDANEAASTPESSWFGMAVLNYVQELKNRPLWAARLKGVAGHMLVALSVLQQWP